ncbi:MAG: YitT family protein [Chloroflexota bacterium]
MSDRWFGRTIVRRLPGLLAGLVLFGAGIAVMAASGLGLGPWEAFHQGIAGRTDLQLGTVSILVGIPVLALWWPLGERPGIGTILNVATIGTSTNLALPLLPRPDEPVLQLAMSVGGVLIIGLGSGLYLSADLGPGPRDGLMTGLHHRFGWSIRRARTAVEVLVLVAGFLLGGTIGLGTVLFAFGIGPVVQAFLRVFDREGRVSRRRRPEIVEELEAPGTVGE